MPSETSSPVKVKQALLASSLKKDQRGTEHQRWANHLVGSSGSFIQAQTVTYQSTLPSPSPRALCSPAEIRGAEQQAQINGELKKLSRRLETAVSDGPQSLSRCLPELQEPGDHKGPPEGLSPTAGHHVRRVIYTGPQHVNSGLHHGKKHLQRGMSNPIPCFEQWVMWDVQEKCTKTYEHMEMLPSHSTRQLLTIHPPMRGSQAGGCIPILEPAALAEP